MTTESQKAFEAAYPHYDHRLGVDGKYHSRASEDAYTYFTKGVAYGRKQALEELDQKLKAVGVRMWSSLEVNAVLQELIK